MFFPSLPSGLFSALDKDIGMSSAVVLPSVVSDALGKQLFYRVSVFIECPIEYTWQSF